jgi:lipoprotein-anchoring transpeptidase ErfK/SrfK
MRSLVLSALLFSAVAAGAAPIQLEITLGGKTLDVRNGKETVASYSISPGVAKHPTPTGNFTVKRIVWNPSWVPPKEGWAKGKKATAPGDPKNPMKVVKIFFKEPDYYIHGTADEHLLGDPASHGCIRMSAADAYALARLLQENGGAKKPDSWYRTATSGKQSMTVKLPQPVAVHITR